MISKKIHTRFKLKKLEKSDDIFQAKYFDPLTIYIQRAEDPRFLPVKGGWFKLFGPNLNTLFISANDLETNNLDFLKQTVISELNLIHE